MRYIVFSKGFGVTVSIDAKETEYQEAKNHWFKLCGFVKLVLNSTSTASIYTYICICIYILYWYVYMWMYEYI